MKSQKRIKNKGRNENMNSLEFDVNNSHMLAEEIVKLLIEKQAIEIKLYDMRGREAITDFYINATGRSVNHTSSLADDIYDKIAEHGRAALHTEGRRSDSSWLLVDYGDVIVNIFDKPSREFYDIDRLMPKESAVNIEYLVAEVDSKFEIKK